MDHPPTFALRLATFTFNIKFPCSGLRSSDLQTQNSSSTDEGVETDLDDPLIQNHGGPRLSHASSSSSSGVATTFNTPKSLSQNLSCDSDHTLSQSSELTTSLPSCTSSHKRPDPNPNHSIVLHKHNPLVHMCSFKTTRNPTRPPQDFREGRRASDGSVAHPVDHSGSTLPFTSLKLDAACKTHGILDMGLVQREALRLQRQYQARDPPEQGLQRQNQHRLYLQPRASNYSGACVEPIQLQTAMQQRMLQQKRQSLQKQCAQPASLLEAHVSRRHMLRQVSYKIAQQQPVLPPLPLAETEGSAEVVGDKSLAWPSWLQVFRRM